MTIRPAALRARTGVGTPFTAEPLGKDRRHMGPPEAFEDAVTEVLLGLAAGCVVSYGWVAASAGYPGRARAVGRFLSRHGGGLPWWRVVRADGRLAAPGVARQV